MGKFYFLNADFDLDYNRTGIKKFSNIIKELEFCFFPALNKDDIFYSDLKLPEEYIRYFKSINISTPMVYNEKSKVDNLTLECWGWNLAVKGKFLGKGLRHDHPDYSLIRKLNSKIYSFEMKNKMFSGADSLACSNLTDVCSAIEKIGLPVIIKPEYGNSGIGFIIKKSLPIFENEKLILSDIFNVKNRVIVERLLDRVADYSIGYVLNKDGTFDNFSIREAEVNTRGVFKGAVFFPDSFSFTGFYDELKTIGIKVAEALHKEGYWGPVGIDSFAYKDTNGKTKLNPFNEINCRHTIASITDQVRRKISGNLFSYIMFYTDIKKKLPQTYEDLKEFLNKIYYDSEKQTGVILLTPLFYNKNNQRSKVTKNLFFVAARDYKQLKQVKSELYTLLGY